jgi:hypothetical protein
MEVTASQEELDPDNDVGFSPPSPCTGSGPWNLKAFHRAGVNSCMLISEYFTAFLAIVNYIFF